jgi:hypothetical protein
MALNELDSQTAGEARPDEYGDKSIRFNFILDGRTEPVKIVERNMDLPFPEGARLVVDEADTTLCDVVFRFDGEAQKPYQLIFTVLGEIKYDDGLPLTYPEEDAASKNSLHTVHRKTILEKDNLLAHIQMQQRKARLLIHYLGL